MNVSKEYIQGAKNVPDVGIDFCCLAVLYHLLPRPIPKNEITDHSLSGPYPSPRLLHTQSIMKAASSMILKNLSIPASKDCSFVGTQEFHSRLNY